MDTPGRGDFVSMSAMMPRIEPVWLNRDEEKKQNRKKTDNFISRWFDRIYGAIYTTVFQAEKQLYIRLYDMINENGGAVRNYFFKKIRNQSCLVDYPVFEDKARNPFQNFIRSSNRP
jgi:hypothetical protein